MFTSDTIKIINELASHVVYFGVIIIPPLFWLWYFRFYDRRHPEPLQLLFFVFMMGFSLSLLVKVLTYFFNLPNLQMLSGFLGLTTIIQAVIFVLLLAIVEEMVKFIILRFYVYYKQEFDEKIDGVIYGITVGLGFATCENVYQVLVHGPEVIFSRFATATLLHAMLGGIIGSTLIKQKVGFLKTCCASIRILILAIFLHFVYNILSIYDIVNFGMWDEVIWLAGIFCVLLIVIAKLKKIHIPTYFSEKKKVE